MLYDGHMKVVLTHWRQVYVEMIVKMIIIIFIILNIS